MIKQGLIDNTKKLIDQYINNFTYKVKLTLDKMISDVGVTRTYILKAVDYISLIKELNLKYFYPVRDENERIRKEAFREKKIILNIEKDEKSRIKKNKYSKLYYKENLESCKKYSSDYQKELNFGMLKDREDALFSVLNNPDYEWKDVVGYEGLYRVSSEGHILKVSKMKLLNPSPSKDNGYVSVALSKEGKSVSIMHHRVVALAFIPNPENKSDVNHMDGVRSNNVVTNLQWMTHAENIQYSFYNLGRISNFSGKRHTRRVFNNSSSQYKGAQRNKNSEKWKCVM